MTSVRTPSAVDNRTFAGQTVERCAVDCFGEWLLFVLGVLLKFIHGRARTSTDFVLATYGMTLVSQECCTDYWSECNEGLVRRGTTEGSEGLGIGIDIQTRNEFD